MLEYKKPIEVDHIPADGLTVSFIAPTDSFEDVARRVDIERLSSFKATFHLSRVRKQIRLTGRVQALVTQRCVASLEEMESALDEPFELEFVLADRSSEDDEELVIDLDAPEPFSEPELDLAEIAIQQLSLAIDPYPRKEGALPVRDEGKQPKISPFAALKDLKSSS